MEKERPSTPLQRPLKDLRIFVASSKELVAERNALAFLVLVMEDEFERRGLRVRLSKWEYVDPTMTEARTEDRYLEEMYDCDGALILFRTRIGKYTREEMEKALARERDASSRLRTHRVLFKDGDGVPTPELAAWRAELAPSDYGTFTGVEGLRREFLALVDRLAESDLPSAPSAPVRTVTALLAADDELASDRDEFADAVLNLNDVLARRGVRIRLRFYDPARHDEALDASEMALVLYHTSCRSFGPDRMRDAYDRTRRNLNPKRLYVFFRGVDKQVLDADFAAFRDGFSEDFGHFFCRFENADTLKLNFLLALENLLGEGPSFVRLEGRTVTADGLDIADITRLPMVANNGSLKELRAELDEVGAKFETQKEICRANPDDPASYKALFDLSTRKNELDERVGRELSQVFSLAKRMASISVSEANETIARARMLLDRGRIEEAIDLLDGASPEIDGILDDIGDLDGQLEQKLKALLAWVDVELFRAGTVLAFTKEPFPSRFAKAEGVYRSLLAKVEKPLRQRCPEKLASVLCSFADIYDEVGDTRTPIPLREETLAILRRLASEDPERFEAGMALTLVNLAILHNGQNRVAEAEGEYAEGISILRRLASENPAKYEADLALSLNNVAVFHLDQNRLADAEREHVESLAILRRLALANPEECDADVATSLNNLANLHLDMNRLGEAEREHSEALTIRMGLAASSACEKREFDVAMSLNNLANLNRDLNNLEEAAKKHEGALEILRRLASENPARYESKLAMSLNNLGTLQTDLNHPAEAEKAYVEAVAIYRRQASVNPVASEEGLSIALSNLALLHTEHNDIGESEREHAEALAIRRRLALRNPAKFDEVVAESLNNLAILLLGQNRLAEAEEKYLEALAIGRRLATSAPEKFEDFVALSLNNLANLHSDQNRLAAAEGEHAESLAIRRRLASVNPAKYDPEVAMSLNNLANLHSDQNRLAEAEGEHAESLAIRRRLASKSPAKYEVEVADSLYNLANLHLRRGRLEEAGREFAKALDVYRRLATSDSQRFEERVAKSLNNLACVHLDQDRFDEAERECSEALDVYRRLAPLNPKRYESTLAEEDDLLSLVRRRRESALVAQMNAASWAAEQGARGETREAARLKALAELDLSRRKPAEAEGKYARALEIYRRHVAENPAMYEPEVAAVLADLGGLHAERGSVEVAESECREALALHRRLAESAPDKFLPRQGRILLDLAVLHRCMGRASEAEAEWREGVEICRKAGVSVGGSLSRKVLLLRFRRLWRRLA